MQEADGYRRMIADLGARDGHAVQHIMPNGSLAEHVMSAWLTSDEPDETWPLYATSAGSTVRLLLWWLRSVVPRNPQVRGERRTA